MISSVLDLDNPAALNFSDDDEWRGVNEALDIVVVDDESPLDDVDLYADEDVDLDVADAVGDVSALPHFDNLVSAFNDKQQQVLVNLITNRIDTDTTARKDWLDQVAVGYKLLGLSMESRNDPWPGACGANSALLIETLTRFVAEVGGETWPAEGPVRTFTTTNDPAVTAASGRVGKSLNHYLSVINRSARGEHEKTLFHCGLGGSAFKKIYNHPRTGGPVLEFVAADHVILPAGAADLRTAPYYIHKLRPFHEEYLASVSRGMYVDIDLEEPATGATDDDHETPDRARDDIAGVDSLVGDNRHTFYEAHIDLAASHIVDDQEAPCRFIITIDRSTDKILSIYRGWDEGDMTRKPLVMMVQYTYMHGPGPYGLGLVHMLGNNTMAGTGIIRSLIDAGTLSNLPAGFKTRSLRVKGENEPLRPGEWRDVDVSVGKLSENLMPLPYKEPSATLMNLYNTLGEESRRFVATADLSVQDMPSNAGSMGMLGMLEKSAKYQAAIITRIFSAMCDELERVKHLLASSDLIPAEARFPDQATKSDYSIAEIIPVADANATSLAQRMSRVQAARDLTQGAEPGLVNTRELYLEGFRIIGFDQPERFITPDLSSQKPEPMDPVAENMAILNIKPVTAFPPQDHEAHMKCHQAFMQDPAIQQMLANSPQAPAIVGAMDAHLREHAAFDYMRRIEQSLGVALPEQRDGLDPSSAGVLAQASDMVLGKSQQRAAAESAAASAQDPVVQQQQQELANKAQEIAIKDKQVEYGHTEKMIELAMKGAEFDRTESARQLDSFTEAQLRAQAAMAGPDESGITILEGP